MLQIPLQCMTLPYSELPNGKYRQKPKPLTERLKIQQLPAPRPLPEPHEHRPNICDSNIGYGHQLFSYVKIPPSLPGSSQTKTT